MAVPGEEKKANEESIDLSLKKKASPFLSAEPVEEPAVKEETKPEEAKPKDAAEAALKDRSIFTSAGKLYFFSKKTNKLETRGEGVFYIFKDKSDMYRLMLIRDQFKLKGCNHYIHPSCVLTKATQLKNSWVWTALQDNSDAEKNEERTVYFATFKNEEVSTLFESKYNEAKEANSKVLDSRNNKAEDTNSKGLDSCNNKTEDTNSKGSDSCKEKTEDTNSKGLDSCKEEEAKEDRQNTKDERTDDEPVEKKD